MQILVLSGSRNPEGQTARAANAISKGATKAGSNTEHIFLPELNLERCRQCENDGWGVCRQEERCIIDDDFSSLVDKIKSSDVIVFATPVYFSDSSESMRGFLDRFLRICAHITVKPAQDISAVGLCLAGGGGGGAPYACFNLERILQKCGFDVVDMIPIRRQNLDAKLPILELIGAWLATKPTSK
ncbi:flavodoxin family protein [Chloroflexota bacterium]